MNQLDIFGQLYKPFKFTKKVRLIELFAGVGSQAMALRDLGIPFEHHRVVEFDKYAIKSYNAIHGTNFPTSDIRDIHASDLDMANHNYQYIMTYSFPCQDLSKAGKQKGMSKGSGTRSGLLWEVERIIGECYRDKCLPDVLLMENVPEVIEIKNIKDFLQWQAVLEACGYQNYVKIINAKDQGIPQKRKRCFMVSILGDYSYSFPENVPLKLRLKDMLELEVDEKYYLSEKMVNFFAKHNEEHKKRGNGFIWQPRKLDGVASTIRANSSLAATDNTVIQIGNCMPSATRDNPNQGRVYDQNGISPTLGCMQGGNRQPMIIQKSHGFNQGSKKAMCPSVTASSFENNNFLESDQRIRKLTPLECWRLMGFSDDDFFRAAKVNSNSQLYKQAGNSIVKQVLMAIFKQMM